MPRALARLVKSLVKLAIYLAAAPFLALYAWALMLLYAGPLSWLRITTSWTFRLLRGAARFLFAFTFLYIYCLPLMPGGAWVPKGLPFHQAMCIPMLPLVFFYALYLVTGREGRLAFVLRKIHPAPYLAIFLAWWYILAALWLWEAASFAVVAPCAAASYFIVRKIFPPLATRPFLVISCAFYALCLPAISFTSLSIQDCGRMTESESIRPLVNYCESGWDGKLGADFSRLLGRREEVRSAHYGQTRAVAPAPDGRNIYISSMGTGRRIDPVRTFRMDTGTGKIDGVAGVTGGANDIDFHMKGNVVVQTAPYQHKVQFLDMDTMKLSGELTYPGKTKPLWCEVDEENGKLYVLFSKYPGGQDGKTDRVQVNRIDLEKRRIEEEYMVANGDVNGGVFSASRRRLYFVTGFAPDGDFLTVFDVDTGKYRSRSIRSFGWDVAHDDRKGVIFVTYMVKTLKKGVVEMFDESNLKSLGYVTTEFGVRHLDFDNESGLLFTGNYITGQVGVVNPYKDRKLAGYFLGRKVRRVKYSPAARKLFVSSCNGFWEIDVSRWTAPGRPGPEISHTRQAY